MFDSDVGFTGVLRGTEMLLLVPAVGTGWPPRRWPGRDPGRGGPRHNPYIIDQVLTAAGGGRPQAVP